MNLRRLRTVLLVSAAAVITVIYILNRGGGITVSEAVETEAKRAPETETESRETLVYVYICGHVKKPDMYKLPEGSRLYDAITMAGGLTEDADRNNINPAQIVKDGERIYIPAVGEGDPYEDTSKDGRIDLNKATEEELMTLPGIGEKKAEIIYRYVAENGPLKDIEQLMEIPGIKEGVFSKIKDFITVN